MQIPKRLRQPGFIAIALLLIGVALWQIEQPRQPVWGKYFQPHADNRALFLTSERSFQQSFQPRFHSISGLLLELEKRDYAQDSGDIRVTVTQEDKQSIGTISLDQIATTGHLFVPIQTLKVDPAQPLLFTVALVGSDRRVGLRFQPDSKKLVNETLHILEGSTIKKRSGHVAFRPQYLATARELTGLNLSTWLALLGTIAVAIVLYWYWQKKSTQNKKRKVFRLSRTDLVVALIVIIYSGVFVWLHLLPATYLPTNGDMTKDMLYLQTASQTIKDGKVPYWHHATCGGQPLLGNPETSVLSFGTLLAVLFGSVVGLKLLLSLEIASAALGTYLLARLLGLKPLGAAFPALLLPLSGFAINRIFLGHTMYIGGIAFMPWILLTGYLSMTRPKYLIVSSGLVALAFFRGDTRVVFYTLIAFGIICVVTSLQKRRLQPLLVCFVIISLAAGFSLVKALPVLEGAEHFHAKDLPELVAPLWKQGEMFNVFLDKSPLRGSIDVLNGEKEGWENIGLYIGLLPIILAFLGLLIVPNKIRLPFGALILLTLLIGEGTFYQETLRHFPMMGQLFRLPSRLLLITVFAIFILGGFTLDKIKKIIPHPVGFIVAALLLVAAVINVSLYAHQTLKRIEFIPPSSQVRANTTTALAVNADLKDSTLHPIPINRSGSVTPYSCQDFNRQPPFNLPDTKPLAMDQANKPLLSSLVNNSIVIYPKQDSTTVQVHVSDSTLLQIENGYVSPTNEQLDPLVIIPQGIPITLRYSSIVAGPGLLLSVGFLLLVLSMGYRQKLG